jgi:hypothetical protein
MPETDEVKLVFGEIRKLSPTEIDAEINSLLDRIRPMVDELELLKAIRSFISLPAMVPNMESSRVKPGGFQRNGFPKGVGGRIPNSEKPTPPPDTSQNLHRVHAFIQVSGPSIPKKVADDTGIPYSTVYQILHDKRYFIKNGNGEYSIKVKS